MKHTTSEAQKRKAVGNLAYEIKMLSRTALVLGRKRKRRLSWVYHNSIIHSFLLAVRNLHEFFFAKSAKDGRIIAAQLVNSWAYSAPSFREGKHWRRIDPKNRLHGRTPFHALVSQRLHHITWSRVDESRVQWIEPAILNEFRIPIENFATALPPALRSKYFDRTVTLMRGTCEAI